MTILYRLYEVLHKLLKKATKIYSDLKDHVQSLSTFWKGENLVSIILLGGSYHTETRSNRPIHHRPQSLRLHHHPHLRLWNINTILKKFSILRFTKKHACHFQQIPRIQFAVFVDVFFFMETKSTSASCSGSEHLPNAVNTFLNVNLYGFP